MPRRLVTFAATTLALDYEGALAERVVDVLFRRLPQALVGSAPKITLTLSAAAEGGEVSLQLDDKLLVSTRDAGELVEHLHEQVSYHFADGCHDGLMVHSSAVAHGGRALLFPAASGSGKSTLAAHLVSRGFSHMTDELSHVSDHTASIGVSGWMRPFEIKHGSKALVEAMLTQSTSERTSIATQRGQVFAPELLGKHAETSLEHAPLHAIIFPQYEAGKSTHALVPLSAAETSARLLQHTTNARNLPHHGLKLVAACARRAKGFTLAYGALDELDTVLRERVLNVASDRRVHGG